MTPNEIAAVRERLISIKTRDLEIAETYQMLRMLTNVRTNGNAKDIVDALAAIETLQEKLESEENYSDDAEARIADEQATNAAIRAERDALQRERDEMQRKWLIANMDSVRVDYLEAEAANDHVRALFRRNEPITREAIDRAIAEYSGADNYE